MLLFYDFSIVVLANSFQFLSTASESSSFMADEHFWSCFGLPRGVKMSKTVEKRLLQSGLQWVSRLYWEEDLRFEIRELCFFSMPSPQFISISFIVFSDQFYAHQLMEFSWLTLKMAGEFQSPLTLSALFLLPLRFFHIQQLLFNCLLPEFRPEIPLLFLPFRFSPVVYSLPCLKLCKTLDFPYISISFLLQHIGSGIFCRVTLSFPRFS